MLEPNGNFLKWPLLISLCAGFFIHCVVSQSRIPLGSKLSVSRNNSWVSPNGDFALAFFNVSDQPNQYSVGIKFNSESIPTDKQAVVWVVGADLVVGNKSYFELNDHGNLVLFDSSKEVVVWSSKTKDLPVDSASLNDDGNLILLSETQNVVWQSFDFPSDTLVPGQNFAVFHTLRAATVNSVSSYYSLFMNSSGQLQLRWDSITNYWTSSNLPGSNLTASLTSKGMFHILDQKRDPFWSVFGEDHNDSIRYRFLRLDIDGNLRMYSWSEDSRSWRSVWQAVENQCNVFATCGRRGVCAYSESGLQTCKCPFKPMNESVPSCLIPFPHRCLSSYFMVNYMHMSLYAMFPPNDAVVERISLRDCQNLCLADPLCTAATFTNDGSSRCLMKKTQYVTGFADPSLRSVTFVKRCSDPMAVNPNLVTSPKGLSKSSLRICFPCLMGAISGTAVVLVVIQLAVVYLIYRRKLLVLKKAVSSFNGPNSNGLIALSFSEIKDITGDFEQQIGPTMFKGTLPHNQVVAVKDVKSSTVEERKYRAAVSKISNIHHRNLVKLKGYCCEPVHRFLIYEYAENGSVDKHIEDPKLCKKLSWARRVEICLSVSRAVCYLHTGCREFVSHGNLKLENVVLDENFEAKVTEFGLHRLATEAAPSSAEKDVGDFGRMVLALVTSCKDEEGLPEWTYKEWIQGNALSVVDKRVIGVVGSSELDRVLRIAFWCIQNDERMRPSMREVVKVLEGTLSVDSPPPPFSCRRQFNDEEDGELSEGGSEPDSSRF